MKFTQYLKRIFIISRPLSWPAAIIFYLVGLQSYSNLTTITFLEMIVITLPLSILIFGLNDIYDMESDQINPRKGDLQGAKLSHAEINWVKKLVIPMPFIILGIAFLSFNLEHFLIALIGVILSIAYSVPPIRLKSKPLIDSIVNGIGTLVPVGLAYTTHSNLSTIDPKLLILAIPMMGLHAITAIEDIEYDKSAGISTIATRFGVRATLFFATITFAIPGLFNLGNSILFAASFIGVSITGMGIFINHKINQKYILGLSMAITVLMMFVLIEYLAGNFFQ